MWRERGGGVRSLHMRSLSLYPECPPPAPSISVTDRTDPSVYLCFGGIHVILILTEFQRCRYTLDTKIVGERALLGRIAGR